MSLYQRVRPSSFAEVVGNRETVASLVALTSQENPPHAFLLTGPSGCGKTTLGRIVALALGIRAEDVETQTGDYSERDSAQFRGIDMIREIRSGAAYVGLHGHRRVWLLDECHKLTNDAMNALLKGLEDPPSHAYFVLGTTEPQRLLETIRSRCSIHRVMPLSEADMVRLLNRIASGEGHRLTRQQLGAIHERAEGKPRVAINLLEKVLAASLESRDAIVTDHEAIRERSDGLARALVKREGWRAVAAILSQVEEDDVEAVRRSVIGYCSAVLLRGEDDFAMGVLDQMIEPFFQSGRAGLIHACYLVVKG